ncbi:hypothetical protein WN944_002281 [Citrus x changshan-huyou]|uniref:Cellulose synthase-like protein E1 n=1 Tax=Citrus x changshan-huyou TaxID=2935761 RepID=A0AAP0ML13_9ROSI
MASDGYLPLFETRRVKAELWFGFYWIFTQSLRWNRVRRLTFRDRLYQRNRYEDKLPGVDIFVCTADPKIEPPMMVINTVLSVMAYDYPTDKLSVYLSDDASSDLTFYALMEASHFSTHWIPYCKKFNVEPRSPAAYFINVGESQGEKSQSNELTAVKRLYEEMENRIQTATKLGRITEEIRMKHKGFSQWDSYSSRLDHDTILQILIDGRDPSAVDNEGCALPTLVYLARGKRPWHFHNFKAGAMNALVINAIDNPSIFNCDMYSNNSQVVRDALCFFMDEEKGHEVAFVQFPQNFDNVTKNELYSNSSRIFNEVEVQGLDGYGCPLYTGSGCFHRREILCGSKYNKETKIEWKSKKDSKGEESLLDLEETSKALASCTYERNTQWGKEMGLKYGCPAEDVVTGLSIQSRGWKSVYSKPERDAFLGVSPTTLLQLLVQHKRWSEGNFQIFISKYCPAWHAHGKISLGFRLGYCCYGLWAPSCLATLFYAVVPSLYLLKGIPLFPAITSPWIIPFAYVIFAKYAGSLVEFLWCGGTALGWWNDQRLWLYKRTSSYLFAFIDTILKTLGFSESAFVVTAKVAGQDVLERYEKEIMEFGDTSSMLTILSTFALLNLLCLIGAVKRMIIDDGFVKMYETMILQILLCSTLVLINWPLYQGLFLRKDNGKMPSSLTAKTLVLALVLFGTEVK